MQNSSPSGSHCTTVPIKVRHRLAKKKVVRRRRVDLSCGCSFYRHIDCNNHGFTHRGIHHCASSLEWRVYMGGAKSPLFHDNKSPGKPVQQSVSHNIDPNPVQPPVAEGFGDSQVFSELQGLDEFTTSDWAFLEGI
ncbi:AC2 [Cotton yellow mosaic virus]|uniref:Transcriptional activator protein n=1 Tax=Cotton yellow mosaic virus TaxID=79236 RepID=A0A191ZS91_9GEMI|nr:AC2 [Cotton yellow mosaic virus]YP_010839292.1 AC2 [Cotton yellow mosaic virus]ALO02632.1 AC2 [Cotton yellow mosaic virus]ANJ70951.1 AC2 [Cotton yellow mosaic virus]ANJ70957.1 AC2 [Cotton yellow mosaic virus]